MSVTKQLSIPGTSFDQLIQYPDSWRERDVAIIAQKYMYPQDEGSIFKMVDRVTDRIATEGFTRGYFENHGEKLVFWSALRDVVLEQKATWNSPVWFNVGITNPPQCWACLILEVKDSMHGESGIMAWIQNEAETFLHGSGVGANLSHLRAENEPLRSPEGAARGTASGPMPFIRWADSGAGGIKSGGRTRRAAKMVMLDVDHPDVLEFIHSKARAERMQHVLQNAGFDMTMNGKDSPLIQYQNANHSVRVTDEFMAAIDGDGGAWLFNRKIDPVPLVACKTCFELVEANLGLALKMDHPDHAFIPMTAKDVWHEIAMAAHACGDPGVQFHDTINAWHTSPSEGEIRGSNPCSEYMFIDDSVCNLSSLNLLAFVLRDEHGEAIGFDADEFVRVAQLMIFSMDILVSMSSYPTEHIKENSLGLRPLGLGWTNLAALLMELEVPYDSQTGRDLAGAVSSLMLIAAAEESAKLADSHGAHKAWGSDAEGVLVQHRDEATALDSRLQNGTIAGDLASRAKDGWHEFFGGETKQQRNAQLTVIAPTGTISFMLGAETTGIEPYISFNASKELSGGGVIPLNDYPVVEKVMAKYQRPDVLSHGLFKTALGQNALSPKAHLAMMAAVQPFISGAISKTVNMPSESSPEDVASIFTLSHELGLKAVAIYRDRSKAFQPITVDVVEDELEDELEDMARSSELPDGQRSAGGGQRSRLPGTRHAVTHKFTIEDQRFYLTTGFYPDGSLGEIFLRGAKEGTFISGMLDSFAVAISIGLQYGVPLEAFATKFIHRNFEPHGRVLSDSEIKTGRSIVDYVFQWLTTRERDGTSRNITRADILASPSRGDYPIGVAMADAEPGDVVEVAIGGTGNSESVVMHVATELGVSEGDLVAAVTEAALDGAQCPECGRLALQWTGNCRRCINCGFDEGCG